MKIIERIKNKNGEVIGYKIYDGFFLMQGYLGVLFATLLWSHWYVH